jgi:hypothetical protein
MMARLERVINSGDPAAAAFAQRELAALTKIRNGEFKAAHKRADDSTFTGKHGESSGWAKLSAKAQEGYNRQSFFDRMFGRKLPSQHTDKASLLMLNFQPFASFALALHCTNTRTHTRTHPPPPPGDYSSLW